MFKVIFLLPLFIFGLYISSYAQGSCTLIGKVKIDTTTSCDTVYALNVREISISGLEEVIRPDWLGNFRVNWIPEGEQELTAIYYNCYAGEQVYMDTIQVSINCERDRIVKVELVLDSECPYDVKNTTCPYCLKNDLVIPIVYGRPTKRLEKKSFKDKILLGGVNNNRCKPHWYCRRDMKLF